MAKVKHSSNKRLLKAHGTEAEASDIINCLTQLVKDPTHIPDVAEQKANTLDLYLTSKPEIYHLTPVTAAIGSSDHCLVSTVHKSNHAPPAPTEKRTFYKYKKQTGTPFASFTPTILGIAIVSQPMMYQK